MFKPVSSATASARPPGAAPLADGAQIKTEDSADLNSIMAEVGGLGKQLQESLGSFSKALNGDGKGGGGIIQKLDKLVTDNTARVDETMINLQDITGKINRGEGTLGKLVNDPTLHDQLLATVAEIKAAAIQAKEFATNAEGIMDQVKSGQGTLGKLINDDSLYNGAVSTVKKVDRTLDGLNDSGPITAVGIVVDALF